jgi:hypothetical protein
MLKWILNMRVWIELMWLKIGSSGGLLWTR